MRARSTITVAVVCMWALGAQAGPLADKIYEERSSQGYLQTVAPMETFDNGRSNQYPFALCTPKKNSSFEYLNTGPLFTAIAEGLTRDPNELVIYETAAVTGGVGGFDPNCRPDTGCITRLTMLNTTNMDIKWQTIPMNASDPEDDCYGCFNYPGAAVVAADGNIYTAVGPMVLKLDGETGEVLLKTKVEVPTGAVTDIVFNGVIILPNGNLVVKNIGRPAGCPAQGYGAITGGCAQLGYGSTLANATIVVLSPELEVLSMLPLDYSVAGRITAGELDGTQYIYLNGATATLRWIYEDGTITPDTAWGPVTYLTPEDLAAGELQASAVALLKDAGWAVFITNAGPSMSPLTMHAISLTDSNIHLQLKPFGSAPRNMSIFPVSYGAAAISVDPENNMVYPFDVATGLLAGYKLDAGASDFVKVWEEYQPTSNFLQLIGPKDSRVIAGSVALDLPNNPSMDEINTYTEEAYAFRDAATGELLAQTDDMGAVFGIWHAPGPAGTFYYWSGDTVWKVTYDPADPACKAAELDLLDN